MRKLCGIIMVLMLAFLLVGCGGGGAASEPEAAGTGGQVPAESAAEEAEEPAAAAEEAEEPAAAEVNDAAAAETDEDSAAAEEAETAAGDPSLIAGMPTSGVDPDSGLEINPPTIVPGVDFIVRGTVISFNLTPQESPEFLIESPAGVRYRVSSQPVPEISFEDGTVLLPHQYQRGVFAQATVRQEEGSGVTSVVTTDNLMLLSGD